MSTLKPLTTLQYLALVHEISYANLCKEIGVTPQQFTDWVKKRRPVPKERLDLIAQYFQVDTNLLAEENHYLYDLTDSKKVDIQIEYINKKLDQPGDSEVHEGLKEKLKQLHFEKDTVYQSERFWKIYRDGNSAIRQECVAFLDQISRD